MAQKNERREFSRVKKDEKREYSRVIIKLRTDITNKDVQIGGWTKDLSVKGVYVICSDILPVGSKCTCRLAIGPLLKGAPIIEVEGKVVRCDPSGVAVQFTEVSVDCFRKLREYFWG